MKAGFGFRVLAAVAALVTAAGVLTATGEATSASVTCPAVDPKTGAVSPAPTPGVDWAGCDLHGADLELADMPGADLAGANLANAFVAGIDLGQANLSGAKFTDAQLRTAFLRGANVSSADFTGADLLDTFMDGTNVTGTIFAGANLGGIQSGGETGSPASLPAHWVALRGYLLGPAANLSHAELDGANLSGLDLAGASLALGHWQHVNFTNADLRDADLTFGFMYGANFSGTDLTNATLGGISSGHVTGTPKGLPSPWVLRDGYFFGPSANLDSAHLAGLDLTGTDLLRATFTNADLFGADLAGLDLFAARMWGTDLRGADLFGADVRQVIWTAAKCPGGGWDERERCLLAFRLGKIITPAPGATVRASARSLAVRFSLLATILGKGTSVASGIAKSLAKTREVRVVLTGKGIKPAAGYCAWNTRSHTFQCVIKLPRHIVAGKSHPYLLTVQEKPQGGFIPAGVISSKDPNPETIYFTR